MDPLVPRRARIEPPGGTAWIVVPPAIHDGAGSSLGGVPSVGEHGAAIRAEFANLPRAVGQGFTRAGHDRVRR